MIYAIALILLALSAHAQNGPAHPICDPAWLALFTPERPTSGRYEVCAADIPFNEEGFHLAAPERLEPLDAFGTAGSYSRAKLVQLYGGSRVTVIRGWRTGGDRFESVTLLSPYPDAALGRLHPGTMIIRWIAPPRERALASSERSGLRERDRNIASHDVQ